MQTGINDFTLYDDNGWINIPAISSMGCWLNVIIGARQVGKTYGTLKYLLTEGKRFVYMRRTVEEFRVITSTSEVNPFLPMEREGFKIDIERAGSIYQIGDYEMRDEKRYITNTRGIGVPLITVAKMRGFDGSVFTDVIFDEFIPEKIAVVRADEGDAALNAYVTINGNRELEGKPALRLWLLANSNNINSHIMQAFGITSIVEKMIRNGKEYYATDDVFVALPKSDRVIKRRQKTKLMSHLGKKSAFYGMAMENRFAYDNLDMIKPKPIKGYSPLLRLGDTYVYDNGTSLYACEIKHNARDIYRNTPEDSIVLQTAHPELKMMYNFGYVTFDSVRSMQEFRAILKIND